MVQAQSVGIGTTAPDASAALEIASSNKGALLPRLTAAQRLGIGSPASGLIVYQTDAPTAGSGAGTLAGFWYNGGSPAAPLWQRLATPADSWSLGGNTIGGTERALGTRDAQDLPLQVNGTEFGRFITSGQLLLGVNSANNYVKANIGLLPDATYSRLLLADDAGAGDVTLLTGGNGFAPWLNLVKQRGTVASPLAVVAGDQLGALNYWGYTGSGYTSVVQLTGVTEGITGGSVRGGLSLGVADGEALHVLANRNVGIGTGAPGARLEISNGSVGLQVRPGQYWSGSAFVSDNSFTALEMNGNKTLNVADNFTVTGGSVGIGTNTPQALLHVAGNFRSDLSNGSFSLYNNQPAGNTVLLGVFEGMSSNGPQMRFLGVGTGFMDIGQNSTGDFVVEGTDSPRLVVQNAGNVGIGTSTPGGRLEISNGVVGLQIRPGEYWSGSAFVADNNFTALEMSNTRTLNVADNFTVTGGNVGIGTNTAVTRLTVKNTSGAALPAGTGTAQSPGHYARFADNSDLVLDMGGNGAYGNWLQSTNQNDLAQTYPLLLNPNGGSVGIGTTTPSQRLEVAGQVFSSTGGFRFPDNTVQTTAAPATTASNGLTITGADVALGGALTSATTIEQSGNDFSLTGGNVGIGISSPTQKLDVVGSVRVGTASTTGKVLTQATGSNNMLAVAYGQSGNGTATLYSTSGNYTLTHPSTGVYTITFPASSGLSGVNFDNMPVNATIYGAVPGFITYTGGIGVITIRTLSTSSVLSNGYYFCFTIFAQ